MLKKRNQKGFTLIEIIAVLVILGILAAVAIPKFMDLQTEANQKAAQSVYAGIQSAASMNFAKGALQPTGHTPITTAASLVAVLEGGQAPEGWTVAGQAFTNIKDNNMVITLGAAEVTGVSRVVITKAGF